MFSLFTFYILEINFNFRIKTSLSITAFLVTLTYKKILYAHFQKMIFEICLGGFSPELNRPTWAGWISLKYTIILLGRVGYIWIEFLLSLKLWYECIRS